MEEMVKVIASWGKLESREGGERTEWEIEEEARRAREEWWEDKMKDWASNGD